MLLSECKVGDRIVGLGHSPYGITCGGWKGYIRGVGKYDIVVAASMEAYDTYIVDPGILHLSKEKKKERKLILCQL